MHAHAASAAVVLGLAGLCSGQAQAAARSALLVPAAELVELTPVDQRYDQAEDARRLQMLSGRIRRVLAGTDRYALLDRGPQDVQAPFRYADCQACVLDWARRRGADVLLVVWVQKESRLILNVNLALVDLRRNDQATVGSVELRGDTDETWLAGAQQLLDRYLGIDTPL